MPTDPAGRLEELLEKARLEHPDPEGLTRGILRRLGQDPDENSDPHE